MAFDSSQEQHIQKWVSSETILKNGEKHHLQEREWEIMERHPQLNTSQTHSEFVGVMNTSVRHRKNAVHFLSMKI